MVGGGERLNGEQAAWQVGRKLGWGGEAASFPHSPKLQRTPRGEHELGPSPGVTARVEKGFFEDTLVRCQEEGVQ